MAAVRTIAVANQKGGVGKTTTVANLGAALAARGLNVCLVDLDPQAHLTLHFGIDPVGVRASVYDVLGGTATLPGAALLVQPHLAVVPSVIDLAGAEVELAGEVGRETILRDRLAEEPLPYELVVIDCPPSLGLLTLNALAAAGEVLIPLQPHFLALQGLGRLLETISLVRRRINPVLRVSGVIFCMYESGTRLAAEVVEDVRRFFAARSGESPWAGARVFRALVRRNIKLAECPGHGQTIFQYEPASHGAGDYRALAEEFLEVPAGAPAETAADPAPPEPLAGGEPAPGEPAGVGEPAPAAEAHPPGAVEASSSVPADGPAPPAGAAAPAGGKAP